MAKRGGYSGGMPGNMANLMTKTVEATAGGGAVRVVVNGRKELMEVELKPEAVDPDDVEMLQDLIVAAVNEALRNADEIVNSSMGQITGGLNLNLPGGMF